METTTMLVCKDMHYEELGRLLKEDWGFVEVLHNGDRYRCKVGALGIGMRYLKSCTSMYIQFQYDCWVCKLGVWTPLQSIDDAIASFDIAVRMPNHDLE
ncbi:hypothetical protein L7F22_054499, partial [Adiantum nelumboides]|nr:hypothetical protein [Adiantum nelumboides]